MTKLYHKKKTQFSFYTLATYETPPIRRWLAERRVVLYEIPLYLRNNSSYHIKSHRSSCYKHCTLVVLSWIFVFVIMWQLDFNCIISSLCNRILNRSKHWTETKISHSAAWSQTCKTAFTLSASGRQLGKVLQKVVHPVLTWYHYIHRKS